jgi:hypothetical protein
MISNDVYTLSAAFAAGAFLPASDRMARPL